MMRSAVLGLLVVALGATTSELDSQYVLQRYALQMAEMPVPKVVVFEYTVSQAGLGNFEQRHVLYRSGLDVRDETIAVDGTTLREKRVRFEQRPDRYAIDRIAPRVDAYQLLFLHAVRDGSHYDYVYEATPLVKQGGTWVDRVTIDGTTFLPRTVQFQTAGGTAHGSGTIAYAPAGKYWMPVAASVEAIVDGKPARERITWSDYRFPPSLPPSTFTPPHPLPLATLPPI
ncbi:MAG TPA: hypothetical protein VMH02_03270 [Verrucomicrobiae bacterium]|nr:hypothetical protein [Verrucomicrobiae bacterium]